MQRLLYGYWRSSASYRLRIALNLKMLDFEQRAVHLVKDGGEQHKSEYRALNAQGLVPTLLVGADGTALTQSLAALEYLEEVHPEPPLLPVDAFDRARVRAIALAVACEMHPLNNLSVLKYLEDELGVSDEQKLAWYQHWIARGFSAVEEMLDDARTGLCCHGDLPTFADICLVPQVYNARRFDCDLSAYPTICRIEAACLEHPAFREAAPERQPDAQS